MANKKITELDEGGSLESNDYAPIARGTRTYKVKIGESTVPVGSIVAFAGSTIPNGWLKCNGDALPSGNGTVQGKTANFSTLRNLIGANLPDLRGYFIRGLDDSRGIDANRTLGSSQNDILKDHTHDYTDKGSGSIGHGLSGGTQASSNGSTTRTSLGVNAPGNLGTETRPKNIALHYIIKY